MIKILKTFFIILIFFFSTIPSRAFDTLKLATKADTIPFYSKIRLKASKYKLTNWIVEALLKPYNEELIVCTENDTLNCNLFNAQGKIIRAIKIITLDPFDTYTNNPYYVTKNKLTKLENKTHIKTSKRVIKNLLLLKENDVVQEFLSKESERIIRSTNFIRDVVIEYNTVSSDSVDMIVVTQDHWSISADGDGDPDNINWKIGDVNIFGTGHELFYKNTFMPLTQKNRREEWRYYIPNIARTFFQSTNSYRNDLLGNVYQIKLERPFISPIIAWTLGSEFQQINRFANSILYKQYNVWAGVSSGKNQKSKWIYNVHYMQFDLLNYEKDTLLQPSYKFILGSIGYAIRNFYKDNWVYNFGRSEDIPEGFEQGVNFGSKFQENRSIPYLSYHFSKGRKVKNIGYLFNKFSTDIYYEDKLNADLEKTIKLESFYFTNLKKIKTWRTRLFFTGRYVAGFNKPKNTFTNLNFNSELNGWNINNQNMLNKCRIGTECIFFTPFNFIGFTFSSIFFANIAWQSQHNYKLFEESPFYTTGLSLLIRNDRLVTNSFQLSVSFYFTNNTLVQSNFNSSGIYSNRLNDFIIGRPEPLSLD